MPTVLRTARLRLRTLEESDAGFIFELVNDPAWLRYIGDRNVHSEQDALGYIAKVRAGYQRHGFGLWVVESRDAGEPREAMGLCGLLRRDTLDDPDVGFAFLPRFRGHGYAAEATAACLDHGRRVLGMARIVAIATPDNAPSTKVLERCGMTYERRIRMDGDEEELALYATGG